MKVNRISKTEVEIETSEEEQESGLKNLNTLLDSVSSDKMLEKAEIEKNPQRKKMMLLYARRKAEIEAMK